MKAMGALKKVAWASRPRSSSGNDMGGTPMPPDEFYPDYILLDSRFATVYTSGQLIGNSRYAFYRSMNLQPFKSLTGKPFTAQLTAGRNWFCFGALTLCLGLLFTSQAHAACGYYVTAGNPGRNVMSASDSAYHSFSASSGQSHHSSDMPQCHAGDSNPATTAAVPSSSDEQGVGLCSNLTTPHILISSALKSHDSSHQPEVYLPLFDPPPRSPA